MITSPCLTRRLWRTTRFIRAEPSSRSSSASTIKTVSLRFFPLTRTVSPRKSWSVSMVLFERAIIELSSLTASVTLRLSAVACDARLGACLHEGVGLLLLLEDGCCDLVILWRVSIGGLSGMVSETYTSGLSAGRVPDGLLAAAPYSARYYRGKLTWTDPASAWCGLAQRTWWCLPGLLAVVVSVFMRRVLPGAAAWWR